MTDLSSIASHYASLTDEALGQEYARGSVAFASEEVWAIVVAEVRRRGNLVPPGSMNTTKGVFQSLEWARSLPDSELLRLAALGRAAHPPSNWALITVTLNRRGLTVPPIDGAHPSTEASLEAAVDAVVAVQEKKSKESDGALAFWVFLGTAIVTLLGLGRLLSFGALIYLLVGGFLSAIVFGLMAFGLRKLVLNTLMSTGGNLSDSTVSGLGIGLLIFDIALALVATRWLTLALFS